MRRPFDILNLYKQKWYLQTSIDVYYYVIPAANSWNILLDKEWNETQNNTTFQNQISKS